MGLPEPECLLSVPAHPAGSGRSIAFTEFNLNPSFKKIVREAMTEDSKVAWGRPSMWNSRENGNPEGIPYHSCARSTCGRLLEDGELVKSARLPNVEDLNIKVMFKHVNCDKASGRFEDAPDSSAVDRATSASIVEEASLSAGVGSAVGTRADPWSGKAPQPSCWW